MPAPVVDTHAAVWHIHDDPRISTSARNAIRNSMRDGYPVFVPSISLVELTYLVEKGRMPSSALEKLRQVPADPSFGFAIRVLDLAVANAIARIPRADIPDLPDRVIAATALSAGLPLVSRDRKIRTAKLDTIW